MPTTVTGRSAPRPAPGRDEHVHVSATLAEDLSRQIAARLGLAPGVVRWRSWPVGERPGPICGWTTDRVDGVFWSFAALPAGPGARSTHPRRAAIAAESWRAHALRKDARAAAWRIREDHRRGRPRPWR
jgi:hypothetical protein